MIFPPLTQLTNEIFSVYLYFYNFYLALGGANSIGWHWSLNVEEQFYLLFPWLLLVIKKNKSIILFLLSSIVLVNTIIRPFLAPYYPEVPYFRFSTHTTIDAILSGCLLYNLETLYGERIVKLITKLGKFKHLIMLLLIVLIFLGTTPFTNKKTIGYSLLNFYCFCTVLIASTKKELVNFPGAKYLLNTGRFSYSIYLCHVPIFWTLRLILLKTANYIPKDLKTFEQFPIILFSWAVIFQVGKLSYILLEKTFSSKFSYTAK